MIDLFENEQEILDAAKKRIVELENGASCHKDEFSGLAKEYEDLLKQLRRLTKISDRTTIDLNTSNSDLLDIAHYDPMTGMYNKRFFELSLKRIVRSLSRSGEPISVLVIDVDFFARYNELYGRKKGDKCLKTIATDIYESLYRADDLVARFDEEDEFAVVLPGTDEKGAQVIVERILENIRASNIPHEKNAAAGHITVSVGVVTDNAIRKQGGDDYIRRAHDGLRIAKQRGRNNCIYVDYYE